MTDLPQYLSPSSAAAFEGCPRRWRFKYVDRLPEPSGQAALVGSFAHRVLELLCELPNDERTLDAAKRLARDAWPEFELDEDYVSLALDDDDARAFRWQSWLAVAGLWELEDPAAVDVVSTEQKVQTDLGPVPFVGIVDRVDRRDGRLVVSDYKSGTLPGSRWRADKIQQVMLYAAALHSSTGELPDRARLLYLGQRILDIRVTERRVEDAIEHLSGTWVRIGEACTGDTFEPRTTVLCGWCPFLDRCPEGRGEIERRHRAGTLPAHAPAAVDLDIEVDVEIQIGTAAQVA
ncbi:MAG: PD-(D/E)XK nuclease family protein [Actinomycetota bacterium]